MGCKQSSALKGAHPRPAAPQAREPIRPQVASVRVPVVTILDPPVSESPRPLTNTLIHSGSSLDESSPRGRSSSLDDDAPSLATIANANSIEKMMKYWTRRQTHDTRQQAAESLVNAVLFEALLDRNAELEGIEAEAEAVHFAECEAAGLSEQCSATIAPLNTTSACESDSDATVMIHTTGTFASECNLHEECTSSVMNHATSDSSTSLCGVDITGSPLRPRTANISTPCSPKTDALSPLRFQAPPTTQNAQRFAFPPAVHARSCQDENTLCCGQLDGFAKPALSSKVAFEAEVMRQSAPKTQPNAAHLSKKQKEILKKKQESSGRRGPVTSKWDKGSKAQMQTDVYLQMQQAFERLLTNKETINAHLDTR